VLASTDCVFIAYYNDFYGLTVPAQQGLTISMSSATFDTWVDMYAGAGDQVAFDDDIDPGVIQNSELHAVVAPGSYIIASNSYDPFITGSYTLTATTGPQALADCELVWLTPGVTITDSLTTTDCARSGPFYSDSVALIAYAGSVLKIAQRSAVVNAKLTLYQVININEPFDGIFVASNDDSTAGTTDAFLSVTVTQSAPYVLVIGSSGAGETGAYTLEYSSSTPAPAPPNGLERAVGRLRIGAGLDRRGTKPPWRQAP
jgi:hypothetical protein